jgi:hypothetical protein
MHARADLIVERGLAVLGAEDQMGVDLGERLRHDQLLKQGIRDGVNMAFGQRIVMCHFLGRRCALPQATVK